MERLQRLGAQLMPPSPTPPFVLPICSTSCAAGMHSQKPLPPFKAEKELLDQMTDPVGNTALISEVSSLPSPVLVLGAGGKMGPTLAVLLRRAGAKRVIGVSRFSDPSSRTFLEHHGIETIAADLAEPGALLALPDAPCVFLLAGFKFGASTPGNEPKTWGMNALLPAQVVQRYSSSKIVYVSSGNVYPLTATDGGGAPENAPTAPIGEYAQSRLGGERLAEHQASLTQTPLCIVRLFYATETRYGILHDLAQKILSGTPIPLAMGHVNQIWQGDANAFIIRCFRLAAYPARTINIGGPQKLAIRDLAHQLSAVLKTCRGEDDGHELRPVFDGSEAPTALLGNFDAMLAELGPPQVSVSQASSSYCAARIENAGKYQSCMVQWSVNISHAMLAELGPPQVSVSQMISWVGAWVGAELSSLGKPTKFEARDGKF